MIGRIDASGNGSHCSLLPDAVHSGRGGVASRQSVGQSGEATDLPR